MRLHTLGRLALEEARSRREKPLLLAAHLALEGPAVRRRLADLFWPGAADPMNSLSVALRQLRALGAVGADEARAWPAPDLSCDAAELRAHLRAGRPREAARLYGGAFVDGLALPDLGEELEEWIYATREDLAAGVRGALRELAEQAAGLGQAGEAAALAERAYRVPGAPPPEPGDLPRLHALLAAGAHPLAETLRREARDLGLTLPPVGARPAPGPRFVGRRRELARLAGLGSGGWAWVRGETGSGKTALLSQLGGLVEGAKYLPARRGLPLATLEPLLGGAPDEETALSRLRALGGTLLVDGWERVDAESQALLRRLRDLRAPARVVVAAEGDPALSPDLTLDLGPLTAADLAEVPGAFEATGGAPPLLAAFLRGEPLAGALEEQLGGLSPEARSVYGGLALLERPDLALVRRALGLSAAGLGRAHDTLRALGLVEASGAVRARHPAETWLGAHPPLRARLAAALAPLLPPLEAYPLFELARGLSDVEALPEFRAARLAWANELLRRGFPLRAVQTLEGPDEDPDLGWLRATALEQAGRYREALEALPGSEGALGLRSDLLWRLGRPAEALAAAGAAVRGDPGVRARGLNTLGKLAFSGGDHRAAAGHFRRAAALWFTLGEDVLRMGALTNLGVARSLLGEPAEEAYREALEASRDHPAQRATVLLNLGKAFEAEGQVERAAETYRQADVLAGQAGRLNTSTRALNNLGVLYHNGGALAQAEEAYLRAMNLARQSGETLMLAMILGNLAELRGDLEALEEAVLLLEEGGHTEMLGRYRGRLEAFRLRSGGSDQA